MTAINRAYVEAASGVYDAPTAIRRAVQDMAAKGITGATYQRSDGTIVRYDLEGVARRDTLTAAHRLANDVSHEACGQIGATHVEVSSHIGARVSLKDPVANHAGWQGKIYRIEGSDEYPNLREKTGYPDEIQGLGGVNCRHRMYPFIPGASVPAQRDVDPAENERLYRLTQRQRRYEREIRKLKRQKAAAVAMGDRESVKSLRAKLKEKQLAMNRFCEQNGLKRDWNREAVAQESALTYNKLIPENNASVDDTGRVVKPWTPETAKTMARQINGFLDREFDLRESRWSGNIRVVDSFQSARTIARKNWSCDITIRRDADAGSIMHELLHARSVSYHTPLQFRTYYRSEEGAVSYLTKAISAQQGMFYNPSYAEQVNALERSRQLLRPNASDFEFAMEFYHVDMPDRYEWLHRELSEAAATISSNDRQYLERLFYDCLRPRRWYE